MLRGLDYQNSRTHLSRVCGWVCGVRGCHRLWLSESLLVRGDYVMFVWWRGVSVCVVRPGGTVMIVSSPCIRVTHTPCCGAWTSHPHTHGHIKEWGGCGYLLVSTPTPYHLCSGSVLLSHTIPHAVPSALEGLTTGFGMGPGVSLPLWPPENLKTIQ